MSSFNAATVLELENTFTDPFDREVRQYRLPGDLRIDVIGNGVSYYMDEAPKSYPGRTFVIDAGWPSDDEVLNFGGWSHRSFSITNLLKGIVRPVAYAQWSIWDVVSDQPATSDYATAQIWRTFTGYSGTHVTDGPLAIGITRLAPAPKFYVDVNSPHPTLEPDLRARLAIFITGY